MFLYLLFALAAFAIGLAIGKYSFVFTTLLLPFKSIGNLEGPLELYKVDKTTLYLTCLLAGSISVLPIVISRNFFAYNALSLHSVFELLLFFVFLFFMLSVCIADFRDLTIPDEINFSALVVGLYSSSFGFSLLDSNVSKLHFAMPYRLPLGFLDSYWPTIIIVGGLLFIYLSFFSNFLLSGEFISNKFIRYSTIIFAPLLLVPFVTIHFEGNEILIRLLSSVIGALFGIISMWTLRIMAGIAAQQEAMGFGDVLLLGAMGSYLGWQGLCATFISSVLVGLVLGVTLAIINKSNAFAFGPALSASGILTIFAWSKLKSTLFSITELFAFFGWQGILIILFVILFLTMALLYIVITLKKLILLQTE